MAWPRRRWLLGAGALGLGAWAARPADRSGAPDAWFAQLAQDLRALPAMPTLVIDQARLQHNLAKIRALAHPRLPLRVVAKSLPSLPLIDAALLAWKSQAAMVFNAPQLVLLARERPALDLLLGKPLPVSAAAWAIDQLDAAQVARVQWLVDRRETLNDYTRLARTRQRTLRISIEIDIGLHRGGVEDEAEMAALLDALKAEPALRFAGLMGYDAHVAALPDLPGVRSQALEQARLRYQAHQQLALQRLGPGPWTLNGAGSLSFHLHDDQHAVNELSVGSAALLPSDFARPALADLLPAAFIATPLLKRFEQFRLPTGVEPLARLAAAWDPNQRQAGAIHGGHWLADPVSPPGLASSGLFGPSSNQQVVVAPAGTPLRAGDWVFLRPRQSEALLLQFGALALRRPDGSFDSWPVFPASA